MRNLIGAFINWLGWPGFVQETDYHAKGAEIRVRVKRSRRYTTITVNGIDIYFDRLTGQIDGTGLAVTSGSPPAATVRSGHLGGLREPPPATARTRTP